MNEKFVWIPEAPNYPGVYANDCDDTGVGKIRGIVTQPATTNPNKALHFESESKCQKWCDEHPTPAFVPKEHGFYT